MSLSSAYPLLKDVHVAAVIASGSLFAARAVAGLLGARQVMHPVLRYTSYAIDVVLLSAAVTLAFIVGQAPFLDGWLTVKVLLLVAYIVLGSIALKRGRTRASRARATALAVLVYLFIASVALTHDPRGVFAFMAR